MKILFVTGIVILLNFGSEQTTEGMFGKLHSGFQMAGKLLGLDRATGISELVAKTFGKTVRKDNYHGEEAPNIFSGFLRILGFDFKKIGAIAVNAIIFIAQLISMTLSRPPPAEITEARKVKPGTPYDWMMNNSHVPDLMAYSLDKGLPDQIIMNIKERSLDEQTGCIQLLLCKSAPFVWSMQGRLNNTQNNTQEDMKGRKVLYAFLPSLDEVASHGDACEKKYPYCFFMD